MRALQKLEYDLVNATGPDRTIDTQLHFLTRRVGPVFAYTRDPSATLSLMEDMLPSWVGAIQTNRKAWMQGPGGVKHSILIQAYEQPANNAIAGCIVLVRALRVRIVEKLPK